MPPIVTFLLGLTVLILFGWYFSTDKPVRKRILGSVLTVLLVALCVLSIWPPKDKIHLGLDLQGGTTFRIQLVRPGGDQKITQSMQDQAVEVIRSRVDKFGIGEPVISPVGTDEILVQIPGLETSKVAQAREQLQRVAKLEFRLVYPGSERIIAARLAGQPVVIPPGYAIVPEEHVERPAGSVSQYSRYNALMNNPGAEVKKTVGEIVVHSKPDLLGDTVVKAFPYTDQNGWGVSLEFSSEGTKEFAQLTEEHAAGPTKSEGDQLAIMLDGKVVSHPYLKTPIYNGVAQISGGSIDEGEARDLASVLENPLQTPVKILEERHVSATLGADSIKSGILSGLVGLSLTFLFVLVYYRLAGLFAWGALLVNVALLFGVMSMFNFVLTLPGIAGIILTIATAIDANVLIYERLREELAVGKTLRPALEGAFNKALSSIIDANVTTLITSVILFYFASGPVKGFAVTLTVGIIASLYAALIVTRNLFSWATEVGGLKKVRMLNIMPERHFDFMGSARLCVTGSLVIILLSVGVFAMRGEKNFGIDFKGGDLLILATKQKLTSDQVRDALPADLKDSVVQIGSQAGEDFVDIRSAAGVGSRIENALRAAFPQAGFEQRQAESVGSLVGKQLAERSAWAFGLGVLGILIYVSVRFEFSFAVGAIVALFHDVIITIGVFALLGRELSLVMVGAVLTIAGYSINDTIVVYDRIRSGLREGRRGNVREIMNNSINETLGRTILTSGATLITVAALFLGGGLVLRDFALAMLVGVVVGTYSSIFIASPIVLWFSRRGAQGDLRREIQPKLPTVSSASA